MGFSGGGSNVLLPHTHDGTVAQDGGPLDFDNVTQADLTAGDVVYSDGTHLQRLAIGTPAQQIKVNAGATAPEYFTPATASQTWTTLYDSGKLAGAGSLDSGGTFAEHDILQIYSFGALNSSDGQGIKFNNDSTANHYCFSDFRSGSWRTTSNYPCIQYTFASSENWTNTAWTITQRTATEKMINGFITEQTGTGPTDHPAQDLSSGMWLNTADKITRVTLTDSNGNTVDYKTGGQLVVLGSS